MTRSRRLRPAGASLIELLLTILMASFALLAAAVPFIGAGSFRGTGRAQTEAQRDAQMALRSLLHYARSGTQYTVTSNPGDTTVTFNFLCGTRVFEGGPNFNGGTLRLVDNCQSPARTVVLIDGNRSRVNQFTASTVTTNLLALELDVRRLNRRNETLRTQVHLRNA